MDPAELANHLVGLSQRVDTLTTTMNDLRLENDALRNQNFVQPRDRPEPKVCPPEPFLGDRKYFRQFISSCRLMFELRPRTYYSDRVRILTLISYLKGEPRVWADAYVEEHGDLLGAFNTFIDEMSLLYEDPNKQLTAENTIRNLKQGKRPVEDYISEFKCWCRETLWTDIALRNQFRLGLSESMKDELARVEIPTSLEDLMHLSLSIDRRLRERKAERTNSYQPTPFRRTWSPPKEVPMEVSTIKGLRNREEGLRISASTVQPLTTWCLLAQF